MQPGEQTGSSQLLQQQVGGEECDDGRKGGENKGMLVFILFIYFNSNMMRGVMRCK